MSPSDPPEGALLHTAIRRLGPRALRTLLRAAGTGAISALEPPALIQAGLTPALAEAVRSLLSDPDARAAAAQELVAGLGAGDRILDHAQVAALPGLAQLSDAPVYLAVNAAFDAAALSGRRVALVGTRDPSDYGARITDALTRALARAGCCLISGGAEGVDGAAHQGALAEGGQTVAVLGASLQRERARRLSCYAELFARGGVVTEELGSRPVAAWMFARRNRLIAALAQVVVVVEGQRKSGALITADWARRLARPLLAVPGRVGDARAEAPNALLAQGARACRGADDVLAAIEGEQAPAASQLTLWSPAALDQESSQERALVERLERAGGALHVDDLAAALSASPQEIASTLLKLELAGRCRQRAGQRYELVTFTAAVPPSKG